MNQPARYVGSAEYFPSRDTNQAACSTMDCREGKCEDVARGGKWKLGMEDGRRETGDESRKTKSHTYMPGLFDLILSSFPPIIYSI